MPFLCGSAAVYDRRTSEVGRLLYLLVRMCRGGVRQPALSQCPLHGELGHMKPFTPLLGVPCAYAGVPR